MVLESAEPVRSDGATRGDRAEATALLVGGAVLLVLPFVAVLDRMGEVWFGVSLLAAGGGVFIGALGVRWFTTEGPALSTVGVDGHPGLAAQGAVALPATVRLVEATSRLRAHGLRFAALGSAVLLLVVELGDFKWAVVGLFGISFVADHVLLRPRRYRIDSDGLRAEAIGTLKVTWADVGAVYWRWYPDDQRPPFPSGERIIVERGEAAVDLEFVFHRRYGGTDAALVVEALRPVLGDRLKVLQPGGEVHADVGAPAVSEVVEP